MPYSSAPKEEAPNTCGNTSANVCGYMGRGIVTGLAVIAILLGVLGATTCNFIAYESTDGTAPEELEFPFENAVKAKIGIFSFQILQIEGRTPVDQGCKGYPDTFASLSSTYPSITAAQFCALLAPIFGGIALLINVFELCICSFYGSCIFSSFLFIGAAGIQAGVFSLVADPVICFDEGQDCSVESGVYLSAVAVVCYFFAGALLCCLPRPNPWCFPEYGPYHVEEKKSRRSRSSNRRSSSAAAAREEEAEDADGEEDESTSHRPSRYGWGEPAAATATAAAIDDDESEDNSLRKDSIRRESTSRRNSSSHHARDNTHNDETNTETDDPDVNPEAVPPPRRRRSSATTGKKRKSKQQHARKSMAQQQDELEAAMPGGKDDAGNAPPRTAAHVQVTEKTFPDGSREVFETTHFADGSTQVKSQVYAPGEGPEIDSD